MDVPFWNICLIVRRAVAALLKLVQEQRNPGTFPLNPAALITNLIGSSNLSAAGSKLILLIFIFFLFVVKTVHRR